MLYSLLPAFLQQQQQQRLASKSTPIINHNEFYENNNRSLRPYRDQCWHGHQLSPSSRPSLSVNRSSCQGQIINKTKSCKGMMTTTVERASPRVWSVKEYVTRLTAGVPPDANLGVHIHSQRPSTTTRVSWQTTKFCQLLTQLHYYIMQYLARF